MEEWKSYKLGDISTIQTGPFGSQLHQSDYVESGVPCIMPTNIGRMLDFQVAGIAHISEGDALKLSRHIVHEGDIVYSRRGDIEKCAYVSQEQDGWFCGTGCLKITINSNLAVPKFVAYYLSTDEIKSWIVGNAVGTTMLNLNTSVLADVPLSLPSIQMQKRCVQILDSIENKIALNNRINHNLEEQAHALYKSWFVDFEPFKNGTFVDSELGMIPEGWVVRRLGDVCKCVLGGTPSRNNSEYWGGSIAWINSGAVNEFRIIEASEYITEKGLNSSATKLLPNNTVVLAITGATLGQFSILAIPSCANQSVIGILQNGKFPTEYIYPLIANRIDDLMLSATGGAQQHINKNNVEELYVLEPTDDVMSHYLSLTRPLYEQINAQYLESNKLSCTRDYLLPRLMDGFISV